MLKAIVIGGLALVVLDLVFNFVKASWDKE